MTRRELARFHDLAASSKKRGEGIGFAGVGIKLGLLVSRQVVTETRRGTSHVSTSWHLAQRRRAPWRWQPPAGRVAARGTAVRLELENPLSPLLDPGFLETALRRHYAALFDIELARSLAERYSEGVAFVVDGWALAPDPPEGERIPLAIRLGRRRKPVAIGYLFRAEAPLPEADRGVAISTLGKVVLRGWDWLGLAAPGLDRIQGLVEAPALAACLTLNKAELIRVGARGATYLAYRKAIQEAVAAQLAAWGEGESSAREQARRRKLRPLERDLEQVLEGLADDFPLLASLVDHRPGGQRRLPVGSAGASPSGSARVAASGSSAGPSLAPLAEHENVGAIVPQAAPVPSPTPSADTPTTADPEPALSPAPAPSPLETGIEPARTRRAKHRYGLTVDFERRPAEPSLARLVESTVWINEAHPAAARAAASRSEGYHLAVAVGLALAPLVVAADAVAGFLVRFLAVWGGSVTGAATGHRKAPASRRPRSAKHRRSC